MSDSSLGPASPRAKWIAELRSGKHKQGRLTLHQIDEAGEHRYCCLGVACIVAEQHGIRVTRHKMYGTIAGAVLVDSSEQNSATAEWLGLNGLGDSRCTTMNDSDGLSFAEIADVLESQTADRWFKAAA